MPLRRHLRSLTWLALVVIVGLALGPTVSRSLDRVRGPGVEQIAFAGSGAMMMAGEHGADHLHRSDHHSHHGGAPVGGHDHLDHCPLCGVAAHAWTLVPALPIALVASAHRATSPPNRSASVPARRGWVAAQPRGPPRSC